MRAPFVDLRGDGVAPGVRAHGQRGSVRSFGRGGRCVEAHDPGHTVRGVATQRCA